MKRLLVTGFAPFLGETINPSQLLLQSCAERSSDCEIRTLLLPVSYADAFPSLRTELEKKNYDVVIMLGQASGRSKISLERVAINWQESVHADEVGYIPNPGAKINETAPNALFSSLPLEKIKSALEKAETPVEISFTAGAFVCNSVFYQTALFLEDKKTPNGFIHVPLLPEQGIQKPGAPTMPLVQMEKALEIVISCLQ